jgi:hypothetical protein
MADLVNLAAETGRNIIGDDATPVLELQNTGTGAGLRLKATGAANATLRNPLELVGTSIASGAVLGLVNNSAYVSVSTIKFTTGTVAGTGAIRIVLPNGAFGWIPVLPDGTVTGIAV